MKIITSIFTPLGFAGRDDLGRLWIVINAEPFEEIDTDQLRVIRREGNTIIAVKAT
jgi:hypothetical protein